MKPHVADARLGKLQALPTRECHCSECQDACSAKPGWFAPGQAEQVAEHLGITLQELFNTKLMADYLLPDPFGSNDVGSKPVFALSPAIVGQPAGVTFPSDPSGKCVFLKKGRCEIHAVKPLECKLWSCRSETSLHKEVGLTWKKLEYQLQVQALLEAAPEQEYASHDDDPYDMGGPLYFYKED